MKKLITLACGVVTAALAHGAALDWSYYSEDDTFDGYTIYAVNAAKSADLYALLATDGDIDGFNTAITDLGAAAQKTSALDYGEGYAEQGGMFNPGNGTLALFMIKDTSAGSTFYYTADADVSGALYEPPASGDQVLFGDGYGDDAVAKFASGTIAAPEPTSGLLLLLGVAGLALRRRRA